MSTRPLAYSLILLGLSATVFAENPCDISNNPTQFLAKSAIQIQRDAEVKKIETSPYDYCNDEMAKRHLLANGKSISELNQLSEEQLLKASESQGLDTSASGWEASLIPSPIMKQVALFSELYTPEHYDFMESPKSIDQLTSDAQKIFGADPCKLPKVDGGFSGAGISYSLDQLGKDAPVDGGIVKTALEEGGSIKLCGELVTTGKMARCTAQLSSIMAEMTARGPAGEFTEPKLFQEVIGSPAYDKGLVIAAQKMINRYKSPTSSGADFFTDLKQSFKEAGNSTAQSETMAWNAIGLLSTGGANLRIRLDKLNLSGDRWPSVTALSLIAGVLPALDNKYGREGQLYSLPPGVKGSCDIGKSYHFWMTAYFSHRATLESGDPETAIAAAFSAEKGYQVAGNFTSRSAGAVFLTLKPFSPASQIARADMSYALAGAAFGAADALSIKNPNLNIDRNLSQSVKVAGDVPLLNYQDTRGLFNTNISYGLYKKWNEAFNPNAMYFEAMKDSRLTQSIPAAKAVPAPTARSVCGTP